MLAQRERAGKDGTSTVAVKLRLMRMGKKKQPTYRVVAADSRSPRDGRFIEVVGVYAPRGRSSADSDAVVTIDDAKVIRWLSNGAKPTDRVERLLQQTGTLERFRTGAPPVASPEPEHASAGGAAEAPAAEAPVAAEAPAPETAAVADAVSATSETMAEPVAEDPAAGAAAGGDDGAGTAEESQA